MQRPGARDVGIEFHSLSKSYNMTGWRCAAILGNAEAVKTQLVTIDTTSPTVSLTAPSAGATVSGSPHSDG